MLTSEDRDGALLVELSHGKVNALDLELLHALSGAFAAVPPDRPVVLTGAGRAFSAGVDLHRIADGGSGYIAEFIAALSECFLTIFDHPAPVVAAINGPAIAGGCVLAAACDRRVISAGPIGLAELAVGVPFPTSALEIMRGLVGLRVQDLVLTARTLAPEQAAAIGLVDDIVTADELLPRAFEHARTLGALPPGVFAFTKQQLHAPARERITARAADDDAVAGQLWASDQVGDAIRRYMHALARR